MLSGSSKVAIAVALYTIAEIVLMRYGHKSAAYSLSAAMFAAGNVTLAFSGVMEAGTALQVSVLAMGTAWGVGSLKYPFECAARKTGRPILERMAKAVPTICGTTNLALRLPAIFSAAHAGQYLIAGVTTSWAVADILAGRLQHTLMRFHKKRDFKI